VPKSNAGRKSKYDTHVKPRLKTIKAWKACGITEEQFCPKLGISVASLNNYKHQHLELLEALKQGQDDFNGVSVDNLAKRCTGYEYEERRMIQELGPKDPATGKQVVLSQRVEITKKQVPPDVGANIFWLKNRWGEKWRDRIDQALMNPDGSALNVTTQVVVWIPDNGRQPATQANPRLSAIPIKSPDDNGNGNGNGSH
jgi:hypothetical protein